MSTKKVTGIDDLGDVMKFWEMKDEILQDYKNMINICGTFELPGNYEYFLGQRIKIESLGKKEGDNGTKI